MKEKEICTFKIKNLAYSMSSASSVILLFFGFLVLFLNLGSEYIDSSGLETNFCHMSVCFCCIHFKALLVGILKFINVVSLLAYQYNIIQCSSKLKCFICYAA